MAALRDKQALAVPVSEPAYLVHTPADLPSHRTNRIDAHGSLSDQGVFTGNISETMDGDAGVFMRFAFRRYPQSQWKEFLERLAMAQNFSGEVSNPQVSDVEKVNDPLHFSFDYKREKYFKWNDTQTAHWIGSPLPPMGIELPSGIKVKEPADDPELGAKGGTIYSSSIQLPAGWSMIPPNNIDIVEDWAEYHAAYTFYNGVFSAERLLLIKKNTVPLWQWDAYLAFRRGIDRDWSAQVLIGPAKSFGHHHH